MTPGQLYDGAKILADWLGSGGKPVPHEQAQDRGDVCSGRLSGKSCSYNYRGGWIVPEIIANTIRATLEVKNQMALKVEGEERLGHCEVCACVLSLKIHCPLEKIMSHTSAKDFKKYPPNDAVPDFQCWIVTETANQPKP